jgi:hypothetical protein
VKNLFLLLLILTALLFASIGCDCGDDDDDDNDDNDDDDDNDTTPDDDDDDNDDNDDDTGPPDEVLTAALEFEIRKTASVTIQRRGDNLTASYTANEGADLIADATTMEGTGSRFDFDGKYRMYSLKFTGPAVTGSLCAGDPISYSLTLTQQPGYNFVVGGFTAYCGDGVFTGKPAKIYRVSGPINVMEK